jgi:hypothetical protein
VQRPNNAQRFVSTETAIARFHHSCRNAGRSLSSSADKYPAALGGFLRNKSERFMIASFRLFRDDNTTNMSTSSPNTSSRTFFFQSHPRHNRCLLLPVTQWQNHNDCHIRHYASFKADYDEWYSHGSTGGETKEIHNELPLEGHPPSSALLDAEDFMESLESVGVTGIMDDQDPYKDDQEGVSSSCATIIDDGEKLLEYVQEDAYIELEEDVWILHGRNVDTQEQVEEDSDSSLDY